MTGIVVLWWEAQASRCFEVTHRLLKNWPTPLLLTMYHDVYIDSKPIIVCTLSGRRSAISAREELLIQDFLFREGAIAAAIVELSIDTGVSAASQPLDHHRAKGIVE